MTRPILPEQANWLTPYIMVADAEKSLVFYEQAFGFVTRFTLPGKDGKPAHAEMTYQGKAIIMLAPEGAWGSKEQTPNHSGVKCPIGLYVYCQDVDALTQQARDAGAELAGEPQDMFWGDRVASLRDPDGYVWSFATKVGEFDPDKMPPME